MNNIYLDVADLLIKNILLSVLNHDMVNYFYIYMIAMYIVFFISVVLMAPPFVLCFHYHKEVKNENAFALFGSGLIMLLVGWGLNLCRTNHNMNQALIQSKEAIHMLATKHNVDDKLVWKIAQDIIFCEPNYLKYTANPSVTIECENNNYYGQKVEHDKVKANLNLIQKNHDPELFIMRK